MRLAAPGCGSLRICDRFYINININIVIIIIIIRIYNKNRIKFSQIGGKKRIFVSLRKPLIN